MDEITKRRIVNALRQVSRWAPNKSEARRRASTKLQVGLTKKNKPKYRVFFKCAECKGLFSGKEINVDHKHPAVDPKQGFVDWNTYISRLFCDYKDLQVLCIEHHDIKTKSENLIRQEMRKLRKIKKK